MPDFLREIIWTESLNNFEICGTAIKTPKCLYLDLLPLVTWTLAAVDLSWSLLEPVTPPAHIGDTETYLVSQARGGEGVLPEQGDEPASKSANPPLSGHQSTSSWWSLSLFLSINTLVSTAPLLASHYLLPCKNAEPKIVSGFSRQTATICSNFFCPANVKHMGNISRADNWHLLPLPSLCRPRRLVCQNNPEVSIRTKHIFGHKTALPPCDVPHTIHDTATRDSEKTGRWLQTSSCLTNTVIYTLLNLQGVSSQVPAEKQGSARCFAAQPVLLRQQSLPKETNHNWWDSRHNAVSCCIEP